MNLKSATRLLICAAVVLALLQGCTIGPGVVGPRRLDTPFWDSPPRPVGIVLRDVPSGEIYREGGHSFYRDIVSDTRDADLIAFLSAYTIDCEWLVDRFATLLSDRRFPVIRLEQKDVDAVLPGDADIPSQFLRKWQKLPEFPGEVDLVLVVTPVSWGAAREYVGIFPVTNHHAYVEINVELYDLRNRMLLWGLTESQGVAMPRKWNEPPGQPKVRAAIEEALDATGESVVRHLENWNGARARLVYFEKRKIGGAR